MNAKEPMLAKEKSIREIMPSLDSRGTMEAADAVLSIE
jgi:hypothetical protein